MAFSVTAKRCGESSSYRLAWFRRRPGRSERTCCSPTAWRGLSSAAWIEFAVYTLVVLFITDAFAAAITNYLPATLFLLAAFFVAYRGTGSMPLALGLGGLVLTVMAAGVQQARIALHPTYFNHNALYHLLQAIALFLIFRAAGFLSVVASR